MKLNKTTLATAVAATLALGMSGQASAYIYAGSSLDLSGLSINIAPGGQSVPTTYTFTSANQATVNGAGSPASVSVSCSGTVGGSTGCNNSGIGPVLSAVVANSTANSAGFNRVENTYNFFSPTNLGQYASADSEITVAELVNAVPTSTKAISETNITGTGSASATSTLTSSTLLNFFFTIPVGPLGTLNLDFSADRDLYAAINSISPLISADASAGTSGSVTLTYLGGIAGVVATNASQANKKAVWSPDGTLNGCGTGSGTLTTVTCSNEVDPETLNGGVSTLADMFGGNPSEDGSSDARQGTLGGGLSPDIGMQAYGIQFNNLFAGRWSLKLDMNTTASVNAAAVTVPEPGMLALLGIGLAGMGFASRRKAA